MPYIKPKDRFGYDFVLEQFGAIETKGDLEYCVYRLMSIYMKTREERYTNLHDAVYATVHAAHEFERQRLDKREDQAIQENGEIK